MVPTSGSRKVERSKGAHFSTKLQGQLGKAHQDHLRICLRYLFRSSKSKIFKIIFLKRFLKISYLLILFKEKFILIKINVTIILDFPPGQAKNNSMRKMAAKTLMQIMPQDLADEVKLY